MVCYPNDVSVPLDMFVSSCQVSFCITFLIDEEDSNEGTVFVILDFGIFIDSILAPAWKCGVLLNSVAGALNCAPYCNIQNLDMMEVIFCDIVCLITNLHASCAFFEACTH